MTIRETKSQRKIDVAVNRLIKHMRMDLESARTINVDSQKVRLTPNKLEQLKEHIDHVASIELDEIEEDDRLKQQLNEKFDESVAKYGIQQSLVVELIEQDHGKGYTLKCVAGHMKLAAAKIAGLKYVPCLIRACGTEYPPKD